MPTASPDNCKTVDYFSGRGNRRWLVLAGTWGNPRCSLVRAGRAIRQHAKLLTGVIGDLATMTAALENLGVVLRATARQNKRKKPSTFELLNDPERLGYFLT